MAEFIFEFVGQLVGRLRHARSTDDFAILVRERLAHDHSNHNEGDKHQAIHRGVEDVRKKVINVENHGDSAVKNGDAGLIGYGIRLNP